jgi:cell division protein FtsW (lipid II flippase)
MFMPLLIHTGILGVRFLMTILFLSLLSILSNRRKKDSQESNYTYFVISIVVFFLSFTLNSLHLDLGMTLGLFAIFGIIRYRTETIRTEEMTYLFAFIGISVINSLIPYDTVVELIAINIIIISCIAVAQKLFLPKGPKPVLSEKLKNSQVVVDMQENITDLEDEIIQGFESRYQKKVQRAVLKSIDEQNKKITFTLFY